MDYNYINQLVEKYWQGETTLEEESILQSFFTGDDIPEQLKDIQPFFAFMNERKIELMNLDYDKDFVEMKIQGIKIVKARRAKWSNKLMPFFRAAAIVIVLFTIGLATNTYLNGQQEEDQEICYDYSSYKDTYSDPKMAYEGVESALMMVSKGLQETEINTEE